MKSSRLFATLGLVLAFPGVSAQAQSSTPVESNWIANVSTRASARQGDTIYIGGNFNVIGPSTGAGAPIDMATGQLSGNFPIITADWQDGALACVGDNSGGWYVGGDFSGIGGVEHHSLAHILPDGTLDETWAPDFEGWAPGSRGEVYELLLDGTTLYVAGFFTKIDGQLAGNLAAFDTTTGARIAWDPDADGTVYDMDVSGTTLYVGGDFSNIGGQSRDYLAAFDTNTGLITAWDPGADDYVYSIHHSTGVVYVGGDFSAVDGQSRNGVAAVDATTGLVTSWDPNADSSAEVYALATYGTTLYVGGFFDQMGGQARDDLAAFDTTTGQLLPFSSTSDNYITSLLVAGTNIYVGGGFSQMSGVDCVGVAAFDLATGVLDPNVPVANATVQALAAQGSTLWVGGIFTSIGGVVRKGLAAIDSTTGIPTAWNPGTDDDILVRVLEVDGSNLYIGGRINEVDGQPRNGLAVVDLASGNVTPWNPDAGIGGEVYCLSISGSSVFAGGRFSQLGGAGRNNLAAVDINNGLATSFAPQPDGWSINELLLSSDESLLYVAGDYDVIAGLTRDSLAAIDIATGLATSWIPQPVGGKVYSLEMSSDGSILYAGGGFSTIAGQPRESLAAFDTATHTLTSFDPGASAEVWSLEFSGDEAVLYAQGQFTTLGGQPRSGLGAVDMVTEAATDWAPPTRYGAPGFSSTRFALAAHGSSVYTGVRFTMGLSAPRSGFVEFGRYGQFGSEYCTATVNSTGSVSTIYGTGSDVAADNLFTLVAEQVPDGQLMYFIGSYGAGQVNNPGGSNGNLCVGGGLAMARFLPTAGTTAGGMYSASPNLHDVPLNTGSVEMILSGDTFRFQGWHRENGGQSNFTPGLEVTFQ
ncbi:MAG: PQQ-binding-like beta-propeller repeat protein [bacterium]|nr:PQQ-binding-like beta-propeller repeat protein [bacterium]